MIYIFYFFALVVLLLGVSSLRGGLRFARYIRTESEKPLPVFTPFVSVIAPCRGLDQGLKENLASLFRQHYPNYELLFVTDSPDDPAVAVVEEVMQCELNQQPTQVRTVLAGAATDSGQKVHNLRVATNQVDPQSKVLVFVDSDARPGPDWLQTLVAPLADKKIGAATGYRWFVPVKGSFASHLRSVWNASITSALGEDAEKNFCWGGSTAIRRTTFENLKTREHWRGTISDDFTLTRLLQTAKLPIHFVPMCLVPSIEDCSLRELIEFTNRQLKITRVYAPHLWKPVLLSSLVFCLVFFGGFLLLATAAAFPSLASGILGAIFLLGAAKSYIRLRAVGIPLKDYDRELSRSVLPHLFLWPVASLLYLVNALTAAFSRRIVWRGITYQLKSPNEAVIIRSETED